MTLLLSSEEVEELTGRKHICRQVEALRGMGIEFRQRPDDSPYLFCNRLGQGYISEKNGRAHGFSSIWQRFMKRVLDETDVKERFTEHDLRAKAASDAESLDRAQELLRHANPNTTRRFYRRRAERIAPLR